MLPDGEPAIVGLMAKVNLQGNPEFAGMERQRPATVRIETASGLLERYVPAVHGTADNPMTLEEVDAKVIDLIASIYDEQRGKDTVAAVRGLTATTPALSLRSLLTEA